MFRLNQKGIAHLLVPIILLIGLIVGVYLVTSGNPLKLFSKASMSKPVGPETSFTLIGPNECASGWICTIQGLLPQPDEEFAVKVYARSDIETANIFEARMTFPKDLVEVKEIKTEGSFVGNWIENYYDNETGEIDLTGGVASPGYKTQQDGESALMATIVFKAKSLGKGIMAVTDSSAIYSDLNNIDILTIKRGYDISVETAPSPTPTVSGVFGQAVNLTGDPQFIQIPNSSYLNSSINFTIEAWIKPALPDTKSTMYYEESTNVVSKSSGSANAYDLSYHSYNTDDGQVHYYYSFGVAAQQIGCALVTASSENGTMGFDGATVTKEKATSWKHVAGVVRNGNVYIYDNGQLVAKNEYNIQQTCNNTNTLQFGARSGGTWQDGYFKGQIDEVRLSRVARYDANFTAPTQPFTNDAGIGGLWHLDSNVDDSSGSGGNGQVQGNIQFVDSTIEQPSSSPTPAPSVTPIPGAKGDGNKDNKVNMIDMSVLHTDFNKDTQKGQSLRDGIDMNNDGIISVHDFAALRQLLQDLKVIRVR